MRGAGLGSCLPHPPPKGSERVCVCALSSACVILPLRRHIKDFALVAPVGHGSVSNVFYALCRKSCLRVAIKAYTKAKLTRLNARQVRLRGLEW